MQSACRRPYHKDSGRLLLQSTRLVVTFPLKEHHHTLPCWVTEAQMRITCPKSQWQLWQLITAQSWLTPHHTGLNTHCSC